MSVPHWFMDYSQPPTILQFIQCNERGDDDGSFLVLSSVLIDWVSVLSCPVPYHILRQHTYIYNKYGFIYYGWRWSDINSRYSEICTRAVADRQLQEKRSTRPTLSLSWTGWRFSCHSSPPVLDRATMRENGWRILIIKWRGRLLNFMVWQQQRGSYEQPKKKSNYEEHHRTKRGLAGAVASLLKMYDLW